MRLERVKRWQWVVLSLIVGLALAQARRADRDGLPARLGEGIADQRWFEREVLRQVPLADGASVRAFDRLTVYPMSVEERGRRPVHVVAGMYLARIDRAADAAGAPADTGKLRPYFFIAPVPFQSLADQRAGKPAAPGATVRDYLDGLSGSGVTYTYAWWAERRCATTAWLGGSFVLVGLLWPTALSLLAYGSLRAPREEKGINLWHVKPSHPAPPPPQPVAIAAGSRESTGLGGPPSTRTGSSASHGTHPPAPVAPSAAVRVLTAEPVEAVGPAAEREPVEFAAKRDDFYPTELTGRRP